MLSTSPLIFELYFLFLLLLWKAPCTIFVLMEAADVVSSGIKQIVPTLYIECSTQICT